MTRPLFCFCAAFALGCIASQYFLAPALWLPAAGIVLVLGALGLLLRGPMRRRRSKRAGVSRLVLQPEQIVGADPIILRELDNDP